jgi:hypothetical protein
MMPPYLHPVKYLVSVDERKNLIAQFGIVLCYFLFFHLTGQALSPKEEGSRQFSCFVVPRKGMSVLLEKENSMKKMIVTVIMT